MDMTLDQSPAAAAVQRSPGYWTTVGRRLLRNRLAMLAALVLLGLVLMALFAPALMPADPYAASILKRLKPIGTEHFPLGTDELGRDMLSRLMLGARLSQPLRLLPLPEAVSRGERGQGRSRRRVCRRARAAAAVSRLHASG